MSIQSHTQIISNIRRESPLIHCITNYVTANDVANMLLAVGGSPIMADGMMEVEEIVGISRGLMVNIGTLNENKLESMVKAGKKAGELGLPVVFDPVGAGAGKFRTKAALRILNEFPCRVIRGNASEIKALVCGTASTGGVDAEKKDRLEEENLDYFLELGKQLSRKTGAVTAITGAADLVTDGTQSFIIRNGDPAMGRITGSGCMLDGIIAAFCACGEEGCSATELTALAIAAEGICGETAAEKMAEAGAGTGSFRMYLIDAMSRLTDERLMGGAEIEIR
ncbi:hydroxyethylthiazole kinase [Clostridium sp. MCC353]|uniref:hydroxyethylthiazole kinase n=1 Tax=Clostridium sp. MCC353 TaxID=2592646 RepID=UPI001C0135DD|nr:hydroxyethylthiazole kinase [Clostridium sp. MCC353]MBT9777850.1 hydroxyethylthiazole kinase [Clostridium sp. MCC353]